RPLINETIFSDHSKGTHSDAFGYCGRGIDGRARVNHLISNRDLVILGSEVGPRKQSQSQFRIFAGDETEILWQSVFRKLLDPVFMKNPSL
ncbi:hypothetical protein COT83_05860, partial [Candidatus Peregrinibacteria bacterium CG10_big_fil_rev_8_21_14_0_10_44_7]